MLSEIQSVLQLNFSNATCKYHPAYKSMVYKQKTLNNHTKHNETHTHTHNCPCTYILKDLTQWTFLENFTQKLSNYTLSINHN